MVLKSLFNFPFIFLLPSFPNCSGCTTQQQNSAFSNWDTVRETCQFGVFASGVQQAVQHPHPPPGGASGKYDWSLPGGRAQLAPPGQLETFLFLADSALSSLSQESVARSRNEKCTAA